jgi:CheY-like chemotaxis protein
MDQVTAARPAHRILLVEEQAVSRDLMVLVLGRLNYAIDTVGSGRAAVQSVQRTRYALVLLSTTLPDMAGADLIAALRSEPGGGLVPILALCPDPESPTRQSCLKAGALDALVRPIEIERLLRLVERATRLGPPPAPGTVVEPVIDLDHLQGFTNGDPQLENELSSLFRSSAEIYLQRMEQALASGEAWSPSAHALKGASANLGARRLAALALAAERASPSRAQLDDMRRALAEVGAFFERRSA